MDADRYSPHANGIGGKTSEWQEVGSSVRDHSPTQKNSGGWDGCGEGSETRTGRVLPNNGSCKLSPPRRLSDGGQDPKVPLVSRRLFEKEEWDDDGSRTK